MKTEHKQNCTKKRATYFYVKNIKKWIPCPNCVCGKMTFNKENLTWECQECTYNFTEAYFSNSFAFQFCEKCKSFLNIQDGFSKDNSKHICCNCGYENDLKKYNNVCTDCKRVLSATTSKRCDDCKQHRKNKRNDLIKLGVNTAIFVGTIIHIFYDNNDDETNSDKDDFELNDTTYPICQCGTEMTKFDNWAWYSCPNCGNSVRVTTEAETWYDEIFRDGNKSNRSDFQLADFSHGGELSED